ncbi:fumarylacetoacetate hydrolase family protein [Pedobacter duraquae]|uniref:2-dehydro-3-deoxy-D-arabinonate dehydratase n=1 Tax=Pedobacter duraquae TaxID=425511 RepID=A0A4R6IQF8_9SPHI|nr:fumarylacetoacetate hydrolase family protein [Pedobacter duraquae]TDO24594.1 2-dehydro-3-deoxy-D-arabinonate dehydratase [Pedobacter duraquae]
MMRIYNTLQGIVIHHEHQYFLAQTADWATFINRKNLFDAIVDDLQELSADRHLEELIDSSLLAPIQHQEIWASGVTYYRSREARVKESQDAQGGDFYNKVYDAERPELFFKAIAHRTVGPGGHVRIRKDSNWNVPEPELTLFICSAGTIEGYTVGNDMSSRDIEGENPLYLPQAKSYTGAAALGPCLLVQKEPIDPNTNIGIEIIRDTAVLFSEVISINQMKRSHTELVDYLFRELDFPHGVYLMTGTGIIPADDFTLLGGDIININIAGIGTLTNTVAS